MAPFTRRRFLQHSAALAAALGTHSLPALAEPARSRAIDRAVLARLASRLVGSLVTPESPDYDSSRRVFNRAFDKRPALIVRCANTQDVLRALSFARERELPIAIRGGGHNRAGLSVCDGGVVIDLGLLDRVDVDSARRVARAGAGAVTAQLDTATQNFGLATTLAGCPTVGIAGLTLGGGEGLLMSKLGATCDSLLSADLVTADGEVLRASEDEHPDLFWAIRGGGGNFGIATALEYRLHPVGEVLAGKLAFGPGRVESTLAAFAAFVATAPDEMNVVGIVQRGEVDARFTMLVCHCGDPFVGNRLLAPLRALGPREDELRVAPYLEINASINPAAPVAHFQSNVFLPELDAAAIATIAAAVKDAPQNARVFIVPFHGAITRVPVGDTAFALRSVGYELDLMGRWDGREKDEARATAWVAALRDALRPRATGVYVNQLGETSEPLVREAYAANYARLATLKRKYDPDNVLQSNQNIRPA